MIIEPIKTVELKADAVIINLPYKIKMGLSLKLE